MKRHLRSPLVTGAVVASLLVGLLPVSASALPFVGFNLRGGHYTDNDDFFLGGGFDVKALVLTASPNFGWVFVDNATLYTLNLDASYQMPLAVAQVWAGARYAMRYFEPDGGNGTTRGGLGLAPLQPFVQFKYLYVSDADEFVWMLGARF